MVNQSSCSASRICQYPNGPDRTAGVRSHGSRSPGSSISRFDHDVRP